MFSDYIIVLLSATCSVIFIDFDILHDRSINYVVLGINSVKKIKCLNSINSMQSDLIQMYYKNTKIPCFFIQVLELFKLFNSDRNI